MIVDTAQGPVLVDTGPGAGDYLHPPAILRVFQVLFVVPLRAEEAAIRQISHLGHRPQDVGHIILTHMHFDHCGGLPDFPPVISPSLRVSLSDQISGACPRGLKLEIRPADRAWRARERARSGPAGLRESQVVSLMVTLTVP